MENQGKLVVPLTQAKAEKQEKNLLIRAGRVLKRQTGNNPIGVDYLEQAMNLKVN